MKNCHLSLQTKFFLNKHFYLISFLLLFAVQIGYSQTFQKVYGTASDNGYTKIIEANNGYFALGFDNIPGVNEKVATVSRLNSQGGIICTINLDFGSVWNDAILTANGDLLVVGSTLPIDASSNGLMGLVTLTGVGANCSFSWVKEYIIPDENFYTRVIKNPSPVMAAYPYYVLGSQTQPAGIGSIKDMVLLRMDAAGTINAKRRIHTVGHENFNDIVEFGSGDMIVAGNNGTSGVLFKFDRFGNPLTSLQLLNGDIVDIAKNAAENKIYAAGNSPGNQSNIYHLDTDLNLLWGIDIPQLTRIDQVWDGGGGFMYVTGVLNGNHNVAIKMDDGGTAISWVKYYNSGNPLTFGKLWNLPASGQMAFTDSRTVANCFGGDEAFLAVNNLEMVNCNVSSDMVSINALITFPVSPELPVNEMADIPEGPDVGDEIAHWETKDLCGNTTCCSDFDAFCALVAQGFTIVTDPALCKATVTAPQFDSCHWFSTPPHPQFLDSLQVVTPTDGMWMFNYSQSGTYTICVKVFEETNDSLCWIKEMCTSFDLNCDSCCNDTDVFYAQIEDAISYTTNPDSCKVTMHLDDLPCNYYIEDVVWGSQGQISQGQFYPGDMPMNVYPGSGTYEVCYRVVGLDESQYICIEKDVCDTIEVMCVDTCYCGGFSDMFIRTGGAPSQPVYCDSTALVLGCPNPGFGYALSGAFNCEGVDCPNCQQIDWNLDGPNSNINFSGGFTIKDSYWSINLLPNYFTTAGIYTLTLTGHCGNEECSCEIKLDVNCPDLCPCEPQNIQMLSDAVDKGFATSISNNLCIACFSPIAISECETVDWYLDSPNGTFLGASKGKQTFCTSFTSAGTYVVVMVVTRRKADGSLCEVFTHAQNVVVSCGNSQDCGISVLDNPSFRVDPIAGGLGTGEGGDAPGWEAAFGNPILLEGAADSHDGWTMQLTGNYDGADVLNSSENICVSRQDTGVLTLRLETDPIPGADVVVGRKPPGGNISIVLYSGNSVPYPDCLDGSCYELATLVDLLPFDTSGWFEVNIPYDLGDWNAIDSCSGQSGVPARLAVFVSNTLSDEQGEGPTRHGVHIDNICFNGTIVSVDDPIFNDKIHLFPNPTSGEFVLEMDGYSPIESKLKVMDIEGRTIQSRMLTSGQKVHNISIAALPAGIYFIEITEKGMPVWIEKVVKY